MKFKIQGHSADPMDDLVLRICLRDIQYLGFEVIDESEVEVYANRSAMVYDQPGRFRQLAEECSELAVAASHAARDRDGWQDELATEIADVELMIESARRLVPEEKLRNARERQLGRAWMAIVRELEKDEK